MKKEARLVLVFLFNFLLPGLGFHYSGTKHGRLWLRRLGLATMVAFLFVFPLGVVLFLPYARINYSFNLLELGVYLGVTFCSATLATGVEWKISMKEETLT
jgi:hypothetical protein